MIFKHNKETLPTSWDIVKLFEGYFKHGYNWNINNYIINDGEVSITSILYEYINLPMMVH